MTDISQNTNLAHFLQSIDEEWCHARNTFKSAHPKYKTVQSAIVTSGGVAQMVERSLSM